MSNNKQSSVEWFAKEINELNFWLESRQITNREFNRLKLKVLNKAKAMHHKEVVDFVEDWYCNGPLLGGGVDVVATIEEHYNETYGGNNEQQ